MSRLEEIEAKEDREINEIKSPFMILDYSDYEWLKERVKELETERNIYYQALPSSHQQVANEALIKIKGAKENGNESK